MPYITENNREAVKPSVAQNARCAGELNYQITELLNTYININGRNYQAMNDVVGALEGAKAEFQRRIVNPYEDLKIEQNGDVYTVGIL